MTDKQVLALVEWMVSVNEDPTGEEAIKTYMDIYIVVHSHRRTHSCWHVHKDWRKQSVEWFKSISKEFI